jgi:hypothetical protein
MKIDVTAAASASVEADLLGLATSVRAGPIWTASSTCAAR